MGGGRNEGEKNKIKLHACAAVSLESSGVMSWIRLCFIVSRGEGLQLLNMQLAETNDVWTAGQAAI